MVAYDGTIRNSNRYVVQLLYGEDGMSGEHIEFQDIASIAPSHEAFNRAFYFDITNERYRYHSKCCNLLSIMNCSKSISAKDLHF